MSSAARSISSCRSTCASTARVRSSIGRAGLCHGRRVFVIGAALLQDRAQILAQLLERGPADEPPAVVDTMDRQVGMQREAIRHGDQAVLEARLRLLHDVELVDGSPLVIAEE